jgi:ABC-type bacteriocin/lantibiotic exporter with double-glycine peptidase domain
VRRRLLAPEVVQTSAMDCGPAALKSLLGGFGIRVSYGRLREACQIDLDGSSIDTLEDVAGQLGLDAEQVMVPPDHLLLAAAAVLPAIVVVRQPAGLTHFIVVWRVHGRFVQVMDPATGRRWSTPRQLFDRLYVHRVPVPAAAWREWAGSPEFLAPLRARLDRLGVPAGEAADLLAGAVADPSWQSLAALDAAARMTASLVASGGLARGGPAARLLAALHARALRRAAPGAGDGPSPGAGLLEGPIPNAYWSVEAAAADPEGAGGAQLVLRGAVLVRVRGLRPAAPATHEGAAPAGLSPELAAALAEPSSRPGRELLHLLREGGALAPAALALALLAAGLGVAFEALLFSSFFDLGRLLELAHQRLLAIGFLLAFVGALLLLDLPVALGSLRLGRHLELRLRLAFLAKVPRLGDRYFHSRLTSDMAERSHSVHRLRQASELGESFVRAAAELAATLAGIVWLDPGIAPAALAMGAAAVGVPLLMLPFLAERDLVLRSHTGAIARFYLDALLGLVPIRTHGAQQAVGRQHEGLLVEWGEAQLGLQAANVAADTVLQVLMLALMIGLVLAHLAHRGLDGSLLLLFFWAFNAFTQGHMLTLMIATQYPSHRNVTLRLLEPLGAPEEAAPDPGLAGPPAETATAAGGVALRFSQVSVRAAGHTILFGIDLAVAAGEHVAIVGPSGAGKSTLVGVLLGWHRPAAGHVTVAGEPLAASRLAAVRQETAWVDPAVQIWNRTLLDNLRYGNPDGLAAPLDTIVRQADLLGVLRRLPAGHQTVLGEGGGLVSGGEGQRVRFGRALLRAGVRLAILDEPFRGLDREQRRELLARARRLWSGATLLCITHDVGETRGFHRVLVVERGRIVEDGSPAALAELPGSRYASLLEAEREVRQGLWSAGGWRRLRMAAGRLSEAERDA